MMYSLYRLNKYGERTHPCLASIFLIKSLSIYVRKLQVAILARSSREMSLTVRIVWQYILCHEFASQFGLAFFYTRKTYINYRKVRPSLNCLLNEKGRNAGLAGDRSTVSGKHTRVFNGNSTDRLSQHM